MKSNEVKLKRRSKKKKISNTAKNKIQNKKIGKTKTKKKLRSGKKYIKKKSNNRHTKKIKAKSRKVDKKSYRRFKKKKLFRIILDISAALVIGIILFIGILSLFISFEKMEGYGMMPTLRTGNVLMIRKTETFKRFDLVCYKDGSGKKQFRRIIGLPMEKIEYKEDTLYVANQPIDEKFIVEEINEALENGGHFTENFSLLTLELSKDGFIPENKYFLLGDNRPYSTDSRDFGFIDKKQIIGVVKMKILPINDLSAF